MKLNTHQSSPPLGTNTREWIRTNKEKVIAFAEYLSDVFVPYPAAIPEDTE